ncbi:12869_t:CDS:2, partial [Funneliformis geosporum]
MSNRSLNKLLTGLKAKKRSWIPRINKRRGIKKKELTLEEQQVLIYSPPPLPPILRKQKTIFDFPAEIYSQILSYLLFTDLYSLSSVSKFFRNLLWSESEFTQSIWKNCRLLHNPNYPKLPPPNGMCEQQYIWITLAKRTCQFCKEIYETTAFDKWSVKINCCNLCIASDDYIIEEEELETLPEEIEGCVPYTQYIGYLHENCHKFYFVQDVEKIKKEYDSLVEEERQEWIENKRKELENDLERIKDYQMQDCEYYWSKF